MYNRMELTVLLYTFSFYSWLLVILTQTPPAERTGAVTLHPGPDTACMEQVLTHQLLHCLPLTEFLLAHRALHPVPHHVCTELHARNIGQSQSQSEQSLITYIHIHILLRLSLLGLSMFMRITGIHLSTPRKQRTYWTMEDWPAAGYESDLHVEGCECDPLIGWEEAGRPAPVPLLLATYTWGPYTVFTRISLV